MSPPSPTCAESVIQFLSTKGITDLSPDVLSWIEDSCNLGLEAEAIGYCYWKHTLWADVAETMGVKDLPFQDVAKIRSKFLSGAIALTKASEQLRALQRPPGKPSPTPLGKQ